MADINTVVDMVKDSHIIDTLTKSPNMEGIAIAGLTILGVSTIVVYAIRSIAPVTPFLYANARIQARSPYYISSKKIEELSGIKSISELRDALKSSDYGESLEQSKTKSLRSFHAALEKGFLMSIKELEDMSPKKMKDVIRSYAMFLEATVIKTVYRAKLFDNPLDEDLVFSVGNITQVLLKHLKEAQSIPDLNVVMGSTHYSDIFSDRYENIEEFDKRIDEFVLKSFIDSVKKTKVKQAPLIIDIVNKKVDILNILALIKFRIRGIDAEKQAAYLINNDSAISDRFSSMSKAENLHDLVEAVKGSEYHEAMKDALDSYDKDGSLFHFENKLYKFYGSYVDDIEKLNSLGAYPIASFLIKKEIEKRNLFILSKGIDSGFSAERIKEMVV